MRLWSFDAGVGATGPQFGGYRTNGSETIVSNSVLFDAVNPAVTFTFQSDGVSAYDVFLRENNAQNRSRLNAVMLSIAVPEPGTCLLASLGLVTLFGRRRK